MFNVVLICNKHLNRYVMDVKQDTEMDTMNCENNLLYIGLQLNYRKKKQFPDENLRHEQFFFNSQ